MNTMLLAAQAAGQGGGMGMIIMMVAVLIIFWLALFILEEIGAHGSPLSFVV
jgi:hypothetical protein